MSFEYSKPNSKYNLLINLLRKFHVDGVCYYLYENFVKVFFKDDYMKKSKEYFITNKERIDYILSNLADEKSKKVYIACMQYRTRRTGLNRRTVDNAIEQYFSPDIIRLNNESFVDCGAFNGDTLKAFLKYSEDDFSDYYAFEADPLIADELLQYCKKQKHEDRIEIFNVGVSDKEGYLKFSRSIDGEVTTLGNINEEGDLTIAVNSLDNVLNNKRVTFIKMDIEGGETDAIRGSWHIIQANRPKLAISIYHSMRDMVEIPYELIEKLDNYDFYIRHYTRYMVETILYAIPR